MAFSNTFTTTFNTRKIVDRAFGRCRIKPELISSEYIDIASDNLFLIFNDLSNQGVLLWAIDKVILPLYDGVGDVSLAENTIDVLNGNLRWLQEVEGTNTDAATYRIIDFSDDTYVSSVGVLWSAASVPISLSRSDDGVTWEVVQTETPDAAAGEWTWYDLDSVVASRYFRVLATSGTLSFDDIYTGNTPTEIPLARLNRDDYTNLPNKVFQSNRPLQYWFDRQIPQPVMHLWPIPNDAATVMQLTLWTSRRLMDVGSLTQEVEAPLRWLQAITSMLASRLAYEIPEVDPGIIPMLEAKADKDLYVAQLEERDNSPFNLTPGVAVYTR